MTWFKTEADMCTNGKVAEAGPDGALAYMALLCLHTKKGSGGVVPASCCRPARLRTEAVAFLGSFEPDRIESAIEACVRAELCARRADGAIVVRGWSDAHAVRCSHCRKPNPEPSHKTCPSCRESRKATRQASNGKGARTTRAHGANGAQSGASVSHLAALDSDLDLDKTRVPPYPPKGGGAEPPAADPEPEPETDPAIQLQLALERTGYRSGITSPLRRKFAIAERIPELAATGLTPPDIADLWDLAREKSNEDPGALLAHWLDQNLWREVLDEHWGKAKERSARARKKPADDGLEGVYGVEDPKPIGDIATGGQP